MKFFTKKRRADGVEIAHYHGEDVNTTCVAETTSNSEGSYTRANYHSVKVTEGIIDETHQNGGSVLAISKDYTDNGARLNVEFTMTYPYDEFTVFEMPVSCVKCPVGFQKGCNCGRNVPFKEEDYTQRPATCKLKKVDFEEVKQHFETSLKLYF